MPKFNAASKRRDGPIQAVIIQFESIDGVAGGPCRGVRGNQFARDKTLRNYGEALKVS